jgi:hypothetical protein
LLGLVSFKVEIKLRAAQFSLWLLAACSTLGPLQAHGQFVNVPELARHRTEVEIDSTLRSLKEQKVSGARILLVSPFGRTVEVLRKAKARGIECLLIITLTADEFFASGTSKRTSSVPQVYTVPPFSALSSANVFHHLSELVSELDKHNVKLLGFEITNEFNSGAFNGDLPLLSKGMLLNEFNKDKQPFWLDYTVGMKKIVSTIRDLKQLVRQSVSNKETPIILGGLARPSSSWIEKKGIVLIEPDLALRTLEEIGVDSYVDGYAVHLYPPVKSISGLGEYQQMREYVDARLGEVLRITGSKKPLWVTEWGFPQIYSSNRTRLFGEFQGVLASSRFCNSLGPAFVYDWDENERFRIWNGGLQIPLEGYFIHGKSEPRRLPCVGETSHPP